MIVQQHFFENYTPWQEWYESEQGAFALDCALHLTKHMLSYWPRRGHRVLYIHFDHWKHIELFWESGFDVCGVSPSQAFSQIVPQHLQHMVESTLVRPAALDQFPFENKSFDFVVINLLPASALYPPLHSVLAEVARLAAKGILIQTWNPFSYLGLQHRWLKKHLPSFLQESPWFTWRDICHTLRAQVRTLYGTPPHVCTRSTLIAPLSTWKVQKTWKRHIYNCNKVIFPCAMGALMQMRLTFAEGIPLTGTPLRVNVLKDMRPVIEGAKRSKRTRINP